MDQAGALRALAAKRRSAPVAYAPNAIPATTRQPTRLIAVTSGKGGVGKSNFTLNLGLLWANQGKKVLMVDADMGMANADLLLGWTGRPHLGEFLAGLKSLEDIVQRHPSGLDVIVGLSGARLIPDVLDANLNGCLSELQTLVDRYDIVLFDTGAGAGRVVTDFLQAAQEVVVVTNPEPTAMMDAYSLMKLVGQHALQQKWHLLVNMALNEEEAASTAKSLMKAAQKFLGQDVSYLGCLPRDPEVLAAVRRQVPWLEGAPHAPVSRRLTELARTLEKGPVTRQGVNAGAVARWLNVIRTKTRKGE